MLVLKDFFDDLIDCSLQLISQQPDFAKHVAEWCANGRLVFSGGSLISDI